MCARKVKIPKTLFAQDSGKPFAVTVDPYRSFEKQSLFLRVQNTFTGYLRRSRERRTSFQT